MPTNPNSSTPQSINRRSLLTVLAGLGVGSTVFHRAVVAAAEDNGSVTPQMIADAEWIAGLELSEAERQQTASAVNRSLAGWQELRDIEVDYKVAPALRFDPELRGPAATPEPPQRSVRPIESAAPRRPASADELAFLPVTELAALIKDRKVSSVELTKLYLERLRKYDRILKCVVTLTEDLALQQAERADRELSAGRYRGPLHGIPWGAKDLISVPDYVTGWGAEPFQDQVLDDTATVARRLEEAGAVLVAKLSLGALAWGDKWYGGTTRNPWNPTQGSSGSSAGSAAATAAGLVGFSLGSETLGSIVSPCKRCGSTGLRPTFGRVSRHGCMPLAWSMDKIGPITRSVEDCALVLAAIHGHDGLDTTAVNRSFRWPPVKDLRQLRIGYFETETPREQRHDLNVLSTLGVKLIPIQLPTRHPSWPLTMILNIEASCVFDRLVREGNTEGIGRWPNSLRQGQFASAVDYLRANRIRSLLMRDMDELMEEVDAYVNGDDLGITNLTGHPTVVMPDGFRKRGDIETPTSITFTGRLYQETDLLSLARAYQQATAHHLKSPPLDRWLKRPDEKSDKE